MKVSLLNGNAYIGVDYSNQGAVVFEKDSGDIEKLKLGATLDDQGNVIETDEYKEKYDLILDEEIRQLYLTKFILKDEGKDTKEIEDKIAEEKAKKK